MAITERASARQVAFAGVFAAAFLTLLAVGAVLPVLPGYVRGPLGESDVWVGVITGAFAVTAFVARPVAGRMADRVGRRAVVITGALVAAVAGALVLLPLGIGGLLAARFVLGAGEGAVFTAGATWIVDLAPPERRGRVLGLFGLSVWTGLSVGPVAGQALHDLAGYEAVWIFAAITPLLGALVAARVPEAARLAPERRRGPVLPRAAILPGLALSAANLGYVGMAGFAVLHLGERDIAHPATVFTAFASAVVLTRLVGGNLPDRLGALTSALGAFVAEAIGLVVLAAAQSLPVALAGAVIMGAGFSTLFPALALFVVDRVPETQRGGALGAFTAFFDAGVALGGPIAGGIAALAGYAAVFWAAAAGALLGLGLAFVARRGAIAAADAHASSRDPTQSSGPWAPGGM